jgi:hypothetical protein
VLKRVTRLGQFSPIGRLFSLGTFSKITNLWATILSGKLVNQILTKNWVGLYLGRFFQKFIWSLLTAPKIIEPRKN